ncbi:MAG: cobalt transporter CbiM [Candidatus Hydrogenedentes bacterium]|nr:cobalt transporter CbiM [Candidatus Hydrogenedentota bacterium]
MHIAEGILPGSTLVAGALLAAAGTVIGLRKMDDERTIHVAVLSSALFVASLIHVPVGPAPVHLVLNGLAGLLLGWAIFPAYLTALVLQSVFFGYGGITSLGVNTIVMATPGLLCYMLFGRALSGATPRGAFAIGALSGAIAILCGCALLCGALLTSGQSFSVAAAVVFAGHIPVAVIEAVVTGSVLSFLLRVRPETFQRTHATAFAADRLPESA